ncbi:MAG: 6-bladed beta-propeller [Nitrospirae bacterium]|nr:6-bladed beta-propeller [Nitrospirota bacterium]
MKKGLTIVLFLIILLTAGCASKWALNTDFSVRQLLWLKSPKTPKVKYLMSVKGFEETNTTLRSLLYGKGKSVIVRPIAVSTGRDGRFAIADTGSKSVHLYIPSEKLYRNLFDVNAGGKEEEIISPVGVTFDDELRLYVSDSVLNKVVVFDRQGNSLFSIGKAGDSILQRPTGLAYDHNKKLLYVVDTLAHKIYAFNNDGKLIFSFGRRGNGSGEFNFPTHIFLSSAGQLYVTDAMNFRIQIFDSTGKFLTAFGNHGDGSGDFALPKGVAADKYDIIYVVDSLFDNIQFFNHEGDFLLTLGNRGGDQGEFWLPSGIFIDDNDTLYICDTYNKRVQMFRIIGDTDEF